MSNLLRVLPMAALLALAGCSESPSGTTTPAAPTASTPAAAPAPVAPPPVAAPAMAPVVDASAAAVTGVAECDTFLAAYERCVTDHVPAEARAAMQTGLVQWKQSWTSMAADPNTRAAMPQMCAQAQTASAPGLQAYGCTF